MAEKARTEEEILFPEVKVGDIVIKPWSFGILFEISSMLEIVLDKINEKGILVDQVNNFISYFDMLRVFTIASDEVKKIISITINKSEEEIDKLGMEDGIKIASIIYKQNSTVLKNVLSSLFLNQMETVEDQVEEESKEK